MLVRLVTCTPIARSITNSNSHSPPISRFQPPLSGPPTHLPAPSRRLFPDRPSARADSLRSKRRTFPGKHRRPSPAVHYSAIVALASNDPCLYSRCWRLRVPRTGRGRPDINATHRVSASFRRAVDSSHRHVEGTTHLRIDAINRRSRPRFSTNTLTSYG